jgi:hypothetical protein
MQKQDLIFLGEVDFMLLCVAFLDASIVLFKQAEPHIDIFCRHWWVSIIHMISFFFSCGVVVSCHLSIVVLVLPKFLEQAAIL